MKKYAICLAILSIFNLTSFGEITEPEWSDYCPEEYLKVTREDLGKNEAYWYSRRSQFKAAINACKKLEGSELKRCYEDIESAEEAKNSRWGTMSNAYGEALERGREKSEAYNSNFNPMSYGMTGLMNSIMQSVP